MNTKRSSRSRLRVLSLVAGSLTLGGCASTLTDHLKTDGPGAQIFEGMGAHQRTMTTDSPEAQEYFGQGVAWMYAFNHDEAIRSFAGAAKLDPESAMAWWGIALCEGPNYNDAVMTEERSAAAWGALQEARARIDNTTPLERALIEALTARYADPWPEDRTELEQAYADAMAEVWAEYPDDSDVGVLYAEAMMVQRPWMLYSIAGEPEGDTLHIVATIEQVMEMDPGNPGAAHLYIHAVEPSLDPGRATAAADRLRGQMPGAGHLNHMPSHIYVQVGEWDKAVKQNLDAMTVDDHYRTLSPDQGLQHMYMVHNAHMLAYSAMMVGREAEAMEAARAMWSDVPEEMMAGVAPFIDLWMTSVYDVQKRFGRWDAILAEPAPPEFLRITTAGWHAHRAVAFAAKHDFEGAAREHAEFRRVKDAMPADAVFYGDPVLRILEVSDLFIEGEIALQKDELERAAELLEKAVDVEVSLAYGEPPQWLQPTRHTLGAVYLKAGRFEDAERVYRADLAKWRGNGWSLYGMSRALAGQGKTAEAQDFERQHKVAWAEADEPTTTSCKCIPDA
ncbi:MAG: tetratricopeptide (TPR) repeat protein [Chlamydiales bacterium]|jgi:tetratricopeptide (TPR) repeat protein